MQQLRASRVRLTFLLLVCFAPSLTLARDFSKPSAKPAITYPAHDDHPDDKLCIAADPYDMPDKAHIFSTDFREYGFLPVFFIVTNNGDRPVSLSSLDIQLITVHHSKLTPVAPEDMYRRMSNPQARTTPLPIPFPRKKIKGTISRKEMEEIESSQFAARAVEPHSTQSGFLFFDIQGISNPLAGANLDLTGIADASGKELLYFEIPMEKYLSAPQ